VAMREKKKSSEAGPSQGFGQRYPKKKEKATVFGMIQLARGG